MINKQLENLLYNEPIFKKLSIISEPKQNHIFDIIVKNNDELTFSRTLKYFLDPYESHQLRGIVLEKFLRRIAEEFVDDKTFPFTRLFLESLNFEKAKVHREFYIKESGRLDIFIEFPDRKLDIIIEIKLYSSETQNQTIEYQKWVSSQRSQTSKHLLIFLTPSGYSPSSPEFFPLPFTLLENIFSEILNSPKLNPMTNFIVDNFYKWIKENCMPDNEIRTMIRNIYFKHKKTIDLIMDNIPSLSGFLSDLNKELSNLNPEYIAHNGKYWLTYSPKKWIEENTKLRENSKYTLVRLQIEKVGDNLRIMLVYPKTGSINSNINNISADIFEITFENLERSDLNYLCIKEYPNFEPENLIENWNTVITEIGRFTFETMQKVYFKLENGNFV